MTNSNIPTTVMTKMKPDREDLLGGALNSDTVGALIANTLSRARSTLSEKQDQVSQQQPSSPPADVMSTERSEEVGVENLLDTALGRAKSTLEGKGQSLSQTISSSSEKTMETKVVTSPPQTKSYSDDPTTSNTALAHLLWKSTLTPGVDAAIDATCGNGHDSVFLADLLLLSKSGTGTSFSELYCIDVQETACDTTRSRLQELLHPTVLEDNRVTVLQQSHVSLPQPNAPVGLVCYNLGYLPNSDKEAKSYTTQMKSTLQSIGQAAQLIRPNGLLSVMTYPKTNPNEAYAVQALLECMALFSSNQIDWWEYLEDGIGPDPDAEDDDDDRGSAFSVREAVTEVATSVVPQETTWRVTEHKMMGRPLAPVLFTAKRIK